MLLAVVIVVLSRAVIGAVVDVHNVDTADNLLPSNNLGNTTMEKLPFKAIGNHSDIFRDNITCDSPPKIDRALPPQLDNPRPQLGTVVNYFCDYGYISDGPRKFPSVCKFDEQTRNTKWTNPNMSCIPNSCGDPGYVSNADRIGNVLTFPNSVEFRCHEGYKKNGLSVRYCQPNGEWSGAVPTCERIYCDVPAHPKDGFVKYISLEYGSQLWYQCNKGFILSDHLQRTCTEDGTWSNNVPVCTEVTCGVPLAPENGSVEYPDGLKVGNTALYSCDNGKTLVGFPESKCLTTGEWMYPEPKCLSSCVLPAVSNGAVGYLEWRTVYNYQRREYFVEFQRGKTFQVGESAILRCEQGFAPADSLLSFGGRMQSQVEVTCQGEQWSTPLECKPVQCLGKAPSIQNGFPVVLNRSNGHTIYYTCPKPYTKTREGKVQCVEGTWTGYTPECTDVRCRISQLHLQGITLPGVDFINHSEDIYIQCKVGFNAPVGRIKVSCKLGKWEYPQTVCEKEVAVHHSAVGTTVTASSLEQAGNKHQLSLSNPPDRRTHPSPIPTETTSVELHNCSCTFKLQNINLCVSETNGKQCERNGDLVVHKGDRFELFCNDTSEHLLWTNGMRTNGSAFLTCDICQVWNTSDLPICESTQAGDALIVLSRHLKVQPKGAVSLRLQESVEVQCINKGQMYPQWNSNSTKHPLKFVHTKESDYFNFATTMIIHQFNATHLGTHKCFVMGEFQRPYRATKLEFQIRETDVPSNHFETHVSTASPWNSASGQTATSVDTSDKVGAAKVLNLSTAEDNCYCNYSTSNNKISAKFNKNYLRNGDAVKKGFFVKISCRDKAMLLISSNGTILHEPFTITCSECRQWGDHDLPTCEDLEDIICQDLQPLGNTIVIYSNRRRFNSSAHISCAGSHVLVGKSILKCLANKRWDHPLPNCQTIQDIRCPWIAETGDFKVSYSNDRKIHSTALIHCKDAGLLVARVNYTRTCLPSGDWSGRNPECEGVSGCKIEQQDVPQYLQIEETKEHYSIGDIVIVSCPSGRELTPDVKKLMCIGKSWSDEWPQCREGTSAQ